jgi:3-methyladenine DNA glycosylase AlkD
MTPATVTPGLPTLKRRLRALANPAHAQTARWFFKTGPAEYGEGVNNWDIVDSSAPQIVGRHLSGTGRPTLVRLAKARLPWSRRVAMMATFYTIKQGDFSDALAIARLLLKDEHDLIHKASGWMLREVGQRDRPTLEAFLDRHGAMMPRTMLRHAIEKLPPVRRRHYLAR